MNFLIAVVIGLVVGAIGGVVLRSRSANAIWLAPVLGVVGAVVASAIATAVGDPGYGMKEFGLQVGLAIVGVAIVAALAMRGGAPATTASPSEPAV